MSSEHRSLNERTCTSPHLMCAGCTKGGRTCQRKAPWDPLDQLGAGEDVAVEMASPIYYFS